MGIIIRQSVRGAFWSYLGIVIGYINVGIIMPQFFDTAQIGLVQLFASVSLFLHNSAPWDSTVWSTGCFHISETRKENTTVFCFWP